MTTTAEVRIGGMTMRLTQDVDGLKEMSASLATSKARASDVSKPFRAFQPLWWENESQIFKAQGIPSWAPLSPAYALRKARMRGGKGILRLTDRLYNSLTSQTGDSVYEASPRSLSMGTTVPYSGFHTTGTSRFPARPHVQMLPDYWQRLNGLVFEYINDPFDEASNG